MRAKGRHVATPHQKDFASWDNQDEAVVPSFLSTSTVGCHFAMQQYCARFHASRARQAKATSYVNSANSEGAVSPLLAAYVFISLCN